VADPTTPAPTCPTCGSDPFNSPHFSLSGDHTEDVCAECYDVVREFAASLVRREELLVAALETIRSEAAFGLSFGAGNDVGNKDAALRSIYRITTAPAKPTEAPQ